MPRQPPSESPDRPVLLFDGDCGFCRFWVDRWQSRTGERIDYLPFQSLGANERLSEKELNEAVHLVESDGTIWKGAAAVYRTRELGMKKPRLSRTYRRSRTFAWLSERIYRFVAQNRPFFSCLTRLIFGRRKV